MNIKNARRGKSGDEAACGVATVAPGIIQATSVTSIAALRKLIAALPSDQLQICGGGLGTI